MLSVILELNMNKRIGILTYWGVPNYGAWIQAYALNNVVRTIVAPEDTSVLHIDYLNQNHFDSYYKTDMRLLNAFSYNWSLIPHTRNMNSEELESCHFDTVITGSDSIWEFSVPQMGEDEHLIGNSINCDKLISYAASFGVTGKSELKTWAKTGISRYDSISVRDIHSKNIVDEILGNNSSQLVIDPALLHDFRSDQNVLEPKFKDYIAVYGVTFDEETINNTIALAKRENLKILSLGNVNDWCDMSFRMIELRTLEWLGLIKNARYVVSSTFHGLMMGLSFEKQVKFYQTEYVKNRSQYLLETLSIQDEVYDFSTRLDFSKVTPRLLDLRESSLAYLKKELLDV